MAPTRTLLISFNLIALTFLSFDCNARIPVTKLTNLQCETFDPSHVAFKECRLKMIKRGLPALYVYANLLKPITNVVVELGLYKKASGYKPFLFNTTTDFCQLQRRKTQNLFIRIVYNFVVEFSNLNHTCPFDHDIIFKDLIMTEDKFKLIPLPSGDYMMKIIISTDDTMKVIVKVYFARSE